MILTEIQKHCNCLWGQHIQLHPCVESTNTLAKELARGNAPHGTVVLSDSQTGGRGRMGRHFHSPAGNGIYMSIVLRPEGGMENLMHLTCAAAVAMCFAIEKVTGVDCRIKWTNDLIAENKKVGGILTEPLFCGSDVAVVLGIGINCRQSPEDFPPELHSIAGSLSMAGARDFSRSALAAAMIDAVYEMWAGILSRQAEIMAEYRARCVTLGKTVVLPDGRQGTAVSVTDAGALEVDTGGEVLRIAAGEVSIRTPGGYI